MKKKTDLSRGNKKPPTRVGYVWAQVDPDDPTKKEVRPIRVPEPSVDRRDRDFQVVTPPDPQETFVQETWDNRKRRQTRATKPRPELKLSTPENHDMPLWEYLKKVRGARLAVNARDFYWPGDQPPAKDGDAYVLSRMPPENRKPFGKGMETFAGTGRPPKQPQAGIHSAAYRGSKKPHWLLQFQEVIDKRPKKPPEHYLVAEAGRYQFRLYYEPGRKLWTALAFALTGDDRWMVVARAYGARNDPARFVLDQLWSSGDWFYHIESAEWWPISKVYRGVHVEIVPAEQRQIKHKATRAWREIITAQLGFGREKRRPALYTESVAVQWCAGFWWNDLLPTRKTRRGWTPGTPWREIAS